MEVFIPLGALVVGWLLNEISQYLRVKKEDKKGLSKAISELLDVRHQIVTRYRVAPKIGEKLGLGKELSSQFGEQIVKIFGDDLMNTEEISKRYNEAVDIISAVNPILGFRLRSKELFQQLVEKVDTAGQEIVSHVPVSQQDQLQILEMRKEFLNKGIEVLGDTLRELAWLHGLRTWLSVRHILSRNESDELDKILRELFPQLVKGN